MTQKKKKTSNVGVDTATTSSSAATYSTNSFIGGLPSWSSNPSGCATKYSYVDPNQNVLDRLDMLERKIDMLITEVEAKNTEILIKEIRKVVNEKRQK